jgi:hypothetical protein
VIIGANLRAALEARAAALGRALDEADVERITWIRAMDGHTARGPHLPAEGDRVVMARALVRGGEDVALRAHEAIVDRR